MTKEEIEQAETAMHAGFAHLDSKVSDPLDRLILAGVRHRAIEIACAVCDLRWDLDNSQRLLDAAHAAVEVERVANARLCVEIDKMKKQANSGRLSAAEAFVSRFSKLAAVKWVRERTGMGLADAKNTVEAHHGGHVFIDQVSAYADKHGLIGVDTTTAMNHAPMFCLAYGYSPTELV